MNGSATPVAWHRRAAEAEARVAEKMMSKTDPQRHLATTTLQRETRASGLVAHARCAEATLPERVPNLGKKWTAVSHHHGVDIVATRKFSRTHSSTVDLLASQAIQRKRQGKEQRQRQKEERATKEKESDNFFLLGEYPPWTGTRTVTSQSWSHCVHRCAM